METDRPEQARKRIRFNSIQELMDYIDREARRRTAEARKLAQDGEIG